MRTPMQKYSQRGLGLSVLSLFIFVSCAKPGGEVLPTKHLVDTNKKTTSQKLRQQCYSQVVDRTVKDAKGVVICTYLVAGGADGITHKKIFPSRKFKILKQTMKDSSLQEKISIDASVEFISKSPLPPLEQRKAVVAIIETQCLPNIRYFWSKSDVAIALSLKIGADKSLVDQTLSLDIESAPKQNKTAQISATETANLEGPSGLDYEIQIDQWAKGPKLFTSATLECNKKAKEAIGVTDSEREEIRSDCLKLANQPFCLAVNKMIGHWLGAEDKTDLNCYKPAAVAEEKTPIATPATTPEKPLATTPLPATGTPAEPTVDESSLNSFMSFPVNPIPTKPAVLLEKAKDESAPVSANKIAAEEEADENIMGHFAAVAALTDAKNMSSASDADLTTPKTKISANVPATAEEIIDQSKDPSYQPWLEYTIGKEDMLAIFNCDMSKPIPNKVPTVTNLKVAAPKTVVPSKAVPKT